jgi:hypothetical protein
MNVSILFEFRGKTLINKLTTCVKQFPLHANIYCNILIVCDYCEHFTQGLFYTRFILHNGYFTHGLCYRRFILQGLF